MANNYTAKDSGAGTDKTFKSTETATVHTPHKNIDVIATGGSADIGNSTTQAAITTDTAGPVLGFLRGLVKWAFERMPASLGQKAKTASFPVVLASDQDALQLAAGSVSVGGVKDNGPFYTFKQKFANSATPTTAFDITDALADAAKGIALDDLWISATGDLGVTIREASGADLFTFYYIADHGPLIFKPTNRLRGSANKKLQIICDGDQQIYTLASWHEETPL